ncbi:hypothetical protein OQA88_2768 [Cercophora sp. LCS_1]
MEEYKTFLAENILTEDKVVTYRLLSRSLKVHPNTAKQMLFEFHKSQNARRPGAVHATYVVYGVKKPTGHQNGSDGDVVMTSSMPEAESFSDDVPTYTLSLIKEQDLGDALLQFEEVSSIHVYSVGPHPTKDMALLADVAHEVHRLGATESVAAVAISNPRVRRRERKGTGASLAAGPAPVSKKEVPTKVPVKKEAPKQEAKPSFFKTGAPAKAKEEAKTTAPAPQTEMASSSAPGKKPPAALKRAGSSNSGIMQAFSKAATKVKKEQTGSRPATPSGDDSSMHPMSDDGEDDDVPQPKPRATTTGRKSRKEREEELRRMMEEDDEEEKEEEEERASSPEEEAPEEPPAPEPEREEPTEVVTTSTGGRRRGKRKVMRKKQVMDEEGYLVTIQEPGWESFSEDEAPPATKPKTTSSAPAPATKSKKSGPKGSQGNIMSFFSKK